MATDPMVEPLNPTAPAPEVAPAQAETPQAPPEEAPQEILDPEIAKIPAIQAVMVGSPPAVSMRIKGADERPEVQLMAQNKDDLMAAGLGFYRSISGEFGVVFNGLKIHPQDIKAADAAGKLQAIAPDFDKINLEVAKSGQRHPLLNANRPSPSVPLPASGVAPQAASGQLPLAPPPPASVARKLAAQRIMNLQAGAPTSGAAPGAGRILNSVMKPVV